jgi:GDP/UDP-N,N'-diacetylbacillosamine 2-epimerase (hydrolysing)
MKVAILTSSRADYSIYLPLLKKMQSDSFFTLEIIAFGTHLSKRHGYTLQSILDNGFPVTHVVETMPEDDSPYSVSNSMGKTMERFSSIWKDHPYDLVFCLGDRYEMFAAGASAVPFNIRLAHIHGGEQTTGAIDDVFRHALTHMSVLHFTAAEEYKRRVISLKGSAINVYNVGALSIDNLKSIRLLSKEEFRDQFGIDLSIPSILITFHPETVSFEKNILYINELITSLETVQTINSSSRCPMQIRWGI